MRYWFDMDCLVTMFFAFWGLGDAATTLTFTHLAGSHAEANVLMRMLIDVHPALYAAIKLSAAAGVALLLWHSFGTSTSEAWLRRHTRRDRGLVDAVEPRVRPRARVRGGTHY